MKPIPFSKISINHEERRAIKSALVSGWLTSGPQCEKFEQEFASNANAQHAVSVNSATAGIVATLLALECGVGDHLFVSPYTYTASVAPAISLGMTVHFVDIESDSFNIDTTKLETALSAHYKTLAKQHAASRSTKHSSATDEHHPHNQPHPATADPTYNHTQNRSHLTTAHHTDSHAQTAAQRNTKPTQSKQPTTYRPPKTIIMAVHVGGRVCNMKAINQLAHTYKCTVIEDAAHGQPLHGEGGAIDQRGHYTIFSFYPNKPICAAEGGMIITDSAHKAQRLRVVKNQGIDRAAWNRHQQIGNPHANWWEYDVVTRGAKLNLSELHAAIGRVQLGKCHKFIERRRRIAELYRTHLSDCNNITLPTPTKHHSWHLYQVLISQHHNRAAIMHDLRAQHIETSVHYKPLTLMSYYQQHPQAPPTDTPLADERWHRTISLPIYHGLQNRQVHYIATSLKRALQR